MPQTVLSSFMAMVQHGQAWTSWISSSAADHFQLRFTFGKCCLSETFMGYRKTSRSVTASFAGKPSKHCLSSCTDLCPWQLEDFFTTQQVNVMIFNFNSISRSPFPSPALSLNLFCQDKHLVNQQCHKQVRTLFLLLHARPELYLRSFAANGFQLPH